MDGSLYISSEVTLDKEFLSDSFIIYNSTYNTN